MDDAKTGEANGTTGPNETPSADEPRILNEIIIPRAPAAELAPKLAPAPVIPPAAQPAPASTPASVIVPGLASISPAAPFVKDAPAPQAAPVPPVSPGSTPAESNMTSLADQVGLVRPRQTPAPSPTSAEPVAPSSIPASGFAQILKAVKLPERYDFRAAADRKQPPQSAPASAPERIASMTAPEKVKVSAEQQADHSIVRSVHTLKQDLQEVVHDQRMTLVRAAALEEEKKTPEPLRPMAPHARSRYSGLIFACILLVFLGAAALGGVFLVAQQHGSYMPAPELGNSLVFAEQTASISISGKSPDDVKSAIVAAEGGDHLSIGSILRVVPTVSDPTDPGGQRPATLSEFMSAIGAQPPADLLRALGSQFFLGIHTVDKNAPILVIPVVSYDRAFAGMLSWEGTINSDLAPIFTLVPPYTNQGGIPTNRTFSDDVMNNYDTRVLKDDAGAIEFYYSFPSRNILVIAESPYSFTEIVSRLQAQHAL